MYQLNEVEEKRAVDFMDEHREECGPIDSLGLKRIYISYILTPTGIGTEVKIKCNYCGGIKNITDIDSW